MPSTLDESFDHRSTSRCALNFITPSHKSSNEIRLVRIPKTVPLLDIHRLYTIPSIDYITGLALCQHPPLLSTTENDIAQSTTAMPPKRQRTAAPAAPKGTKKIKTTHTPSRRSPRRNTSDDATSPQSKVETGPTTQRNSRAVKAPVAADDYEWEILDGDNRETLLVGTTASNRLRLRFRRRHNDKQAEIVVHQYKKAANEVDWNSSQDIMDINKWRNEVFHRTMGSPSRPHALDGPRLRLLT